MRTRKLGSLDVSAIGLGCMCLSHAYGTPPDEATAARVLHKALDIGYTHLDSAALYGFGANETLITLSREMQARLDALINPRTVSGARYAPTVQVEIDTEEVNVDSWNGAAVR